MHRNHLRITLASLTVLRKLFTCDLGMTLKHATISVEGMFLKVTLLMAFPVISVVKNASGVTMSWGEDPRLQINKMQHIIQFFFVNITFSG